MPKYEIGTYEPTTGEFVVEFSTDSRFKAWLLEQRIGWREWYRFFRYWRAPRLSFVATRFPAPGAPT